MYYLRTVLILKYDIQLGSYIQSRIANDNILDPKENKKQENYGHDENEWGFRDESEDTEWDRHYHDRNKKWRFKDEEEKT